MKPTLDLADLDAERAVSAAMQAAKAGDLDALGRLDLSLRRRVLWYILRGDGDLAALQAALAAAIDRALELPHLPWGARWESLLDVLEDGRQMPSLERGTARLQALMPDGIGSHVLLRLRAGPLRPSEIAELVKPGVDEDSARSQVSRALGQLEDAGLIERRRLGRATWVSLLPLGEEALKLQPAPVVRPREAANDLSFWNTAALAEKVVL